ncbi:MAG: hypothetical protein WC615_21505 [Mucilaginibacter sp.]|uniref:hypothetical protein n=1 Tax=Mucilaginibacter sp. TaxID=1882438 RepID=UPI003566B88C
MLAQSATISTISGGLTASTVTTGQTQVAFIGFQVSVSGGAPASSLTFTKFDNIGCNFISSLSNIKLYRSTTSNTYGTGTFVPVGTVSTSGNTITINSLVSETIPTGSTYYYFLAADDIYSGATKYDPQIFINTGSFATATNGTTYSAWISNYVGYTFTSPTPPTVTVTAQTGGLAGATLSYGQSAAIFGFSVKVTGTTATLGQFNFNADGNTGTLQTLFGSGVLYSSATNTFNPASPGTPVGTVGFNGNNVTVSSLNEAFTVGQTKYYFLVATQIFSSYSNTDKAGST